MIYIDTSSLLKLVHNEPESAALAVAVAAEADILISTLARFEARVQLKAAWRGGEYTQARYRLLVEELDALQDVHPFRAATLTGGVFATAIRQDEEAGALHLRSLDRLHLGAMEELSVKRLMTHDRSQAAAARALGFETISPGLK